LTAPLLEIAGLTVRFRTERGAFAAVDGLDLRVARGEFLGIVGESGSGKSVTARAIMGLVRQPGRIAGGSIRFDGEELVGRSDAELQRLRGKRMAMIFQEPMSSLNPVFTVGEQIAEVVRLHDRLPRAAAWTRAIEMLARVGIPAAAERAAAYPHQLSGGMRQRVMIAMALACDPELLIADEPTTALDVTIQAQILDLLRRLRDELGLTVLLITHDLGVIAEQADRVAVMYAGRVIEEAPTGPLFAQPMHPYTRGLLDSIPELDRSVEELPAIEGTVPAPLALPPGCRFAPRCRFAEPACDESDPPLRPVGLRRFACRRDLDLGRVTWGRVT
jgi:oligopeptide/dipeptide ABC transporter ATP-binding protein